MAGASQFTFPWLEGVSVLTEAEAADIRDNLILAIHHLFKAMDDLITMTNRSKAEAIIWQLADDEECGLYADGMLHLAMRNEATAWAVRAIANSANWMAQAMGASLKIWRTWQFYAEHGGMVMPF